MEVRGQVCVRNGSGSGSGLRQVWVRTGSGQRLDWVRVWVRTGSGLDQVWVKTRSGLGQVCVRSASLCRSDLSQVWRTPDSTVEHQEPSGLCDVLQHSGSEAVIQGQPTTGSEADRAAEVEEDEAGGLSHQTVADDSDPDQNLLEDDQVDDFASSLLAAISCWHYRAQFLLSAGVTVVTVRLSAAGLVFILRVVHLQHTKVTDLTELSVICCMSFTCGTNS